MPDSHHEGIFLRDTASAAKSGALREVSWVLLLLEIRDGGGEEQILVQQQGAGHAGGDANVKLRREQARLSNSDVVLKRDVKRPADKTAQEAGDV